MANKKQVQKKITHKPGAINSVERAIMKINEQKELDKAHKMQRPIKWYKKNQHTGETIVETIEPNKIKSKTI